MNDFATRIAALPPARRQLLEALLQQQTGQNHVRQTEYAAPGTDVERTLAEIWGLVLGVERVGIHDSFFDLGGDSIHSIQIIAKARQAGLRFTNTQLFEHPTIARLAPHATRGAEAGTDGTPATGDIPLTPIQHWFFAQPLTNVDHWNQAVLLRATRTAADEAAMRAAFEAMTTQHDALRVRFVRHDTGWRQVLAAEPGVAISIVDLTAIAPEQQEAQMRAILSAAQRSLNLANGPLLRLVLCRIGNGAPHRVLFVAHHLVADAVSFRALLDDPGVTSSAATPFSTWAAHAPTLAATEPIVAQAGFWRRQLTDIAPLPRDHEGTPNVERDARRYTVTLDEAETALLRRARPVLGASAQEILLAAVCRALGTWTGQRRIGLWLEGHGRDVASLDLSRTFGWLTALFPLAIDTDPAARFDARLRDVQQALGDVPNSGLGFGLLRYLHPDAALQQSLAAHGADVLFNYLGVFDRTAAGSPDLIVEDLLPDDLYDPDGERPRILQIYGGIVNGRLAMHWAYSVALHRPATIERCAQTFLQQVREVTRRVAAAPGASAALLVPAAEQTSISPHDLAAIVAMHERD